MHLACLPALHLEGLPRRAPTVFHNLRLKPVGAWPRANADQQSPRRLTLCLSQIEAGGMAHQYAWLMLNKTPNYMTTPTHDDTIPSPSVPSRKTAVRSNHTNSQTKSGRLSLRMGGQRSLKIILMARRPLYVAKANQIIGRLLRPTSPTRSKHSRTAANPSRHSNLS
jgi:hypothetical protein